MIHSFAADGTTSLCGIPIPTNREWVKVDCPECLKAHYAKAGNNPYPILSFRCDAVCPGCGTGRCGLRHGHTEKHDCNVCQAVLLTQQHYKEQLDEISSIVRDWLQWTAGEYSNSTSCIIPRVQIAALARALRK